jgi:hypothetical protein
MPISFQGPRLTQLRRGLLDPPQTYGWSRTALARAANVSPTALARLETRGTGTVPTLAGVLRFCQHHGINLGGVLPPDNARIPLQAFRDVFQPAFFIQANDSRRTLRNLLTPPLAALDKGPLALHTYGWGRLGTGTNGARHKVDVSSTVPEGCSKSLLVVQQEKQRLTVGR